MLEKFFFGYIGYHEKWQDLPDKTIGVGFHEIIRCGMGSGSMVGNRKKNEFRKISRKLEVLEVDVMSGGRRRETASIIKGSMGKSLGTNRPVLAVGHTGNPCFGTHR